MVVASLLVVYDIFGIFYLIQDYDVVHRCKASNDSVQVIWPTNLWVYVLLSTIMFTILTACLLVVPLRKSVEAIAKHTSRGKKGKRSSEFSLTGRSVLKYGLLPSLPDWLFLAHGSALMAVAMVFGILAFCGYFELFMARSWCEDKTAAFEELDLWHFGRVSFFAQIVSGSILFLWGVVYWAMPFWFELTDIEGQNGNGNGYGAVNGSPDAS